MSGAPKESLPGLPGLGKACLTTMDQKLNVLDEKVDKLLNFQEDVMEKLQCVYRGMGHLEQGLHRLEASRILGPAGADCTPPADMQAGWPEVLELVRAGRQDVAQQGARLEALFRMVVAVDKAIALLGAVLQNSKVVDFIMQGSVPWRKGSLADGPAEVGSCCPAPVPFWLEGRLGSLVGTPDRKLVLGELEGCCPLLCLLCDLLMGTWRDGNLKTIGGFPDRAGQVDFPQGKGEAVPLWGPGLCREPRSGGQMSH